MIQRLLFTVIAAMVLASVAAEAVAQVQVTTAAEAKALPARIDSVVLQGGLANQGVLAILKESHPHLTELYIFGIHPGVPTGLTTFSNLKHLEIHDRGANLAYVRRDGTSVLDEVAKLTSLETLRIEAP